MRTTQQLTLQCNYCQTDHAKDIKLIAPEAYTDPPNASMLKQFWCEKCKQPLSYRIKFNRDKETKEIYASIQYQVDPDSIPQPKAPPPGITIRPKQKSHR